jgi:3-oxoacyl-[acyl-carrier-protein] synthase-3
VVLEAAEEPGILATAMHADGSQNGILNVPGQMCGGQVIGDPFLRMDGQAVFKFAVRVLAEVAEEVCLDAGTQTCAIDWLIPHQANIRIMEATGKETRR